MVELTNRSAHPHQEILFSSEKEWTTDTGNNLMVLSGISLSERSHSQKVTCCVIQIRRKSTVTEGRLVFTRGGRWKKGVTVTPQPEVGWWNSSVTVIQTYHTCCNSQNCTIYLPQGQKLLCENWKNQQTKDIHGTHLRPKNPNLWTGGAMPVALITVFQWFSWTLSFKNHWFSELFMRVDLYHTLE